MSFAVTANSADFKPMSDDPEISRHQHVGGHGGGYLFMLPASVPWNNRSSWVLCLAALSCVLVCSN